MEKLKIFFEYFKISDFYNDKISMSKELIISEMDFIISKIIEFFIP